MKNTIKLTISIILISTVAYAQKLKPNTVISTGHSQYKIDAAKYGRMGVVVNNNAYYNKVPKNPTQDLNVERADQFGLINSFTQVFNNSRLQQLLPERNITLTYYVSRSGKVLNVSFLVKENTLITAAELENLEDAIKKNISFKLHLEPNQTSDFFVVGQNILFTKVLNRTIK